MSPETHNGGVIPLLRLRLHVYRALAKCGDEDVPPYLGGQGLE